MKTIITKNNCFFDSDLRLNASFHLSDGNLAKKFIQNSPYLISTIGYNSDDIFYGGRAKRYYVSNKEKGTPFIGSSDMLKSDMSSIKYISNKLTLGLEKSLLKKNWTLISRSGTVGNTTFTNSYFEGKAASEHIIRVVPNTKIKSGFLFSYLSSKYGYSLLTQGVFGAVIQHIEPEFVSNIPIPIFPSEKQEEIHNLVLQAAKLRMEANSLLEEVEKKLIEKIKIDQLGNKIFSSSERKAGNVFSLQNNNILTLSFRARNYSPRKQSILEMLKFNNYDKLIDVLERPPFYASRFKRIEASKGTIELLSQGDIFDYKPKGRIISSKNISNLDEEIVKKGTILIPAQGTLGENEIFARAKFVWGYLENKLVAGHAMRFIPDVNKIGEGYLFAILSSKMWFRLLRNSVYGTNLLGFIIPMINEYPIPRFDSEFESNIDHLVKSAYEKHTTSIGRDNLAINLVEKEIESWQQS